MSRNDPYEVFGKIHLDRPLSILFSESGDEDDAVWLPKSRITILWGRDNYATVVMPEWLAEEKGLV